MIEHNHFIFIAQQLHTIVRIYAADHTLLDVIDFSPCPVPVSASSDAAGVSPCAVYVSALPDSLRDFLLDSGRPNGPYTVLSARRYTYSVLPTPDKTLIIGPNLVYHNWDCLHTWDAPDEEFFCMEPVYECSIHYYARVILPSYNIYYEHMVSETDYYRSNFRNRTEIQVQESFSDLVFRNQEENASHNPYSQELRMLTSIEQGDLSMLEDCRRKEVKQNFGILSPDKERSFRNLGICAITLVSRAAIRGGVNAELAFSLCDSYIMEIEKLDNLNELEPLVESAKTNFCTMVKEQREYQQGIRQKSFHPLVEKAKDYIFSNLHSKITLHEAAAALLINPNYLSDLFRKQEGIPFSAFVISEKIKLAKNMLVYSDYSYIEIANYLGFTSQSYLGKQFKEYTGMTLREYRNRYGAHEFHVSAPL